MRIPILSPAPLTSDGDLVDGEVRLPPGYHPNHARHTAVLLRAAPRPAGLLHKLVTDAEDLI